MLSGFRALAQEDVTVTGQLTFRAKSLAQKEHAAHEQDRYWNEKQNDHVSPLGTVTGGRKRSFQTPPKHQLHLLQSCAVIPKSTISAGTSAVRQIGV